jgi:hypothetical protein
VVKHLPERGGRLRRLPAGEPELAYLGINVADTPDEAKSFVERYGWAWPSIQDPQRDRARLLGTDYQPHFILVDANGSIVDTWEGGGDAGI